MNLKQYHMLSLLGFVMSGFGAGVITVAGLGTAMSASGLLFGVVGMGMAILALSKLKGTWSFEVVEE